MDNNHFKAAIKGAIFLGLPLMYGLNAYAAKPVNLKLQPASTLQTFMTSPALAGSANAVSVKEKSRKIDFKKTLHVRVSQTYGGYPVWGSDAVVHIPNGNKSGRLNALLGAKSTSVNGIMYQDLAEDLKNTPKNTLTNAQQKKALQQAVDAFEKENGIKATTKNQQSTLMVYIDKSNKAHWAYQVKFYVPESAQQKMPALMTYVLDAQTFKVYEQWNDVKNLDNLEVTSGGHGGNVKMGMLTYDGLEGNLANLTVQRDAKTKTCLLQNSEVTVKKYLSNMDDLVFSSPYSFPCVDTSDEHNGVYWTGEMGAVNDGYSPGNDALFSGKVIKAMYQEWYNASVLVDEDGKPMMLTMVVHKPHYDNAYWDPYAATMTFGDGESYFYPLTSLGVAAHEVSHGFTSQNSDLNYSRQSGGMNEAFSDMAAQAAEFYAYGKNSWEIGPEIFKAKNRALRYMDKPSKDCNGGTPGEWCSIDHASEYYDGLDVHHSSGVYNRVFYLIGTAEGWDVKKAFDVMVQANANYWTSDATFASGACGVISATKDYGYDAAAVLAAFDTVGVDTSDC